MLQRNYKSMTALIQRAKGRFCSVTFVKKDGTVRTMNIQPARIQAAIKGPENISEDRQRAVETRRARHPNLLPVWDNTKQAIRSVNLDTVQTIRVDKQSYYYGN